MNPSPLVSVVIPAYNQADFVGEAIDSVLNQTYPNFEVIVVNDASPDRTAAVVRQYSDRRVRLISHQQNLGLPTTRNTGIRAAAGNIIALLDADDYFHPDKLAAHVEFLARHPDVGVTYNARFELNHSARTIRELWRPPCSVGLAELMLGFPFAPSDTVVRREWLDQVGLFNPRMGSAEDTDLPCRLALAGCKFAGIDRALNYRRYHSGRHRKNLSARFNDVSRALASVFCDPRCPAELLPLKQTALKHHLMVLVSLAFIQRESQLAPAFVRRLIQLDPAVLTGTPGELVDFLLQESIADESVNHETLLQEMFSQFPPELDSLAGQYNWAAARGYLLRGARAIIWERPADGQAHFARAAALGATLDDSFIQLQVHQLLAYAHEFGKDAAWPVVKNLTSQLARLGNRRSARLFQGCYSVNQAFQSFFAGDYSRVPCEVSVAVSNNPKYLLNRGVLSILVQSLTASPHV